MGQILNAIRKAIKNGDKTRYQIAKDTGITQSQLSRLMKRERGLSIESLERLTDYLELEIIIRPKRPRKGR